MHLSYRYAHNIFIVQDPVYWTNQGLGGKIIADLAGLKSVLQVRLLMFVSTHVDLDPDPVSQKNEKEKSYKKSWNKSKMVHVVTCFSSTFLLVSFVVFFACWIWIQ